MQVLYVSNKLENTIENKKLRDKTYGTLSKRIKMRVDALKAANSLADISYLPPPRRHLLSGKYSGCYGIDINGPYRLVIKPNCTEYLNELSLVTSVTILKIENYH